MAALKSLASRQLNASVMTPTNTIDRGATLRRAIAQASAEASSTYSAADALTKAEELRARSAYSQELHRLSTVEGVKALLAHLGVVTGTTGQLVAEFAAANPPFTFNGHRLPPVDAILGILRRRKREANRSARQQATIGGEVRAFLASMEEGGDLPIGTVADLVESTIGVTWSDQVKTEVLRSAIAEVELGSMRTPKAGGGAVARQATMLMNDDGASMLHATAMNTITTAAGSVAHPDGLPDDLDLGERSLRSATEAPTADDGSPFMLEPENESFVLMDPRAIGGPMGALTFGSFDLELDSPSAMSNDMSFDGPKQPRSLRARRASQAAAATAALTAVDRCVLAHRRKLKAIREQGVKTVGPMAAVTPPRSRSPPPPGGKSPDNILSPAALRLLEDDQPNERRVSASRGVVVVGQDTSAPVRPSPILIVDPNGSVVSDSRLWKSPEQRDATAYTRRANVVDEDVVAMLNTSMSSLTASEKREAHMKLRKVPKVVQREDERRRALLKELGIALDSSSPTGFTGTRSVSSASSRPKRITAMSYHVPPPPPTADEIVWSLHQQAIDPLVKKKASLSSSSSAVLHHNPPRAPATPQRKSRGGTAAGSALSYVENTVESSWTPALKRKTVEALMHVTVLCDYCSPFAVDVGDCIALPDLVSLINESAPLLPPGVVVTDVYVECPDGHLGQFVPLDSIQELTDIAHRCALEKRDLRLRAMLSKKHARSSSSAARQRPKYLTLRSGAAP